MLEFQRKPLGCRLWQAILTNAQQTNSLKIKRIEVATKKAVKQAHACNTKFHYNHRTDHADRKTIKFSFILFVWLADLNFGTPAESDSKHFDHRGCLKKLYSGNIFLSTKRHTKKLQETLEGAHKRQIAYRFAGCNMQLRVAKKQKHWNFQAFSLSFLYFARAVHLKFFRS